MVSAPDTKDACLAGGGEMGELMRALDWSATALGPVPNWPQSLKTAVGICLNSQSPVALWWGPELTLLYNDAFIPILGSKHPRHSLGRPGRECWAEVWDVIGPFIERAMNAGEPTASDDLLLCLNRSGYLEETHFRFSANPVCDPSGNVGGIFTPVTETTADVIGERRRRTLEELSETENSTADARAALRASAAILMHNRWDVPFAVLYLFNAERTTADLAAVAGIEAGSPAAPCIADSRWKLWSAALRSDLTTLERAQELFPQLPSSAWGEAPETLVVAPFGAGFLVAGASPRRRLDPEYQSFFSLAARHIGASIAGRRKVADRNQLEQQLTLLVRASATLLAASPDSVAQSILQLAQDFVTADAYAVWRKESSDTWRMVLSSGLSESYSRVVANGPPPPVDTFAVEDVMANDYLHYRASGYREEGIRSLVMTPLRHEGEVNGTLVFYYRTPHHFSPSEITVCTALGNMAEAALQNARLYNEQSAIREQAEAGRRRDEFLARAGAILASSLDVDRTLGAISELAVPELADWCAIDLIQPNGLLQRIAVRHVNPDLVARYAELRAKYPPREDFGSGLALRSGKALLRREITDEELQKLAQNEEHLAGMRELGIRSSILAPLIVHGVRLGVLSLIRSKRLFEPEEAPFIEELAQRAAFAVHSARLHQAVSENAERLEVATAAAGLGIFEWDIRARTVRWENQRIFDIFHRTREQGPVSYEDFFSSVCHPEDREDFLNEFRAARAARRPVAIQIRLLRADGDWIWAEFSGQFDLDEDGAPRRFIGVIADVTERRRIEERLRERARLESVGLLAGGVAHDFNNLLTGILGNASLALEEMEKSHPARPMIESVVAASDRAAALTRQMLAYSGRGRFVIEHIDLSKLVRDMANLLGASIDRSIELCLELASALPPVEGDPVQIQQLVMNLIINAAEAMQERSGQIHIRTSTARLDESHIASRNPAFEITPGNYVCLEVADQGIGMDEATMARIFDPFFSTKFTGRGLGLSAALGIVRGHKGSLTVQSQPGQGTTFRIYFPAVSSQPPPQPAPRFGTVLVVDDEEIVRTTAAYLIEATGCDVLTAADGPEALAAFEQNHGRIDLTILDLSLPGMSGEIAFERIHQQWPEARVVISTGFMDEHVFRRFRHSAIAGFLQKPWTLASITELLHTLGLVPKSQ